MKKLIMALAFLFLTCPTYAYLKYPYWQNAGWAGGGQYPGLTCDVEVPDRVYLSSDVTGAWYSTDAGENWQWMTNGDMDLSPVNTNIIQDTLNPNNLWGIGNVVIKSTDRGATWTKKYSLVGNRPGVYKGVAIDPNDSDHVFVSGTTGEIIETTDGGENFTSYDDPFSYVMSFVTFSPDGNRLFISEQDEGLWYYDLSDDSLNEVTLTGTNSNYIKDYAKYSIGSTDYLCVPAGKAVACSTDQGDTWSYTSNASQINDSSYMYRMVAGVDESNVVHYVASYVAISSSYTGGCIYSDDGGATWSGCGSVTLDNTYSPTSIWRTTQNPARAMAMDPFNPDVVYRSDDWTVLKSTNGGATWAEKVKGAQDTVATDIELAPNNRLFATAMDNCLMYSDDWGDTWTPAYPDGSVATFSDAGHCWQVKTIGSEEDWATNNGTVIVTSSKWADYRPRILKSTSNGDEGTFTEVTSGLPTGSIGNSNWDHGYPRALAVDPQDSSIIYLGIDGWNGTKDYSSDDGGIFVSSNTGTSWSRYPEPPNWQIYNGLAIDPLDQDSMTFGTFAAYTYYTVNAGTDYTQVTGIPYVYDVVYNADGNVYFSGNSSGPQTRVQSSTGSSTSVIFDPPEWTGGAADGFALNPDDENQAVVGIYGGRAAYINFNLSGGTATWEDYTLEMPSVDGTNDFLWAPDCGTNGCIFQASNGGSVFKLDLEPADGVSMQGVEGEGIEFDLSQAGSFLFGDGSAFEFGDGSNFDFGS